MPSSLAMSETSSEEEPRCGREFSSKLVALKFDGEIDRLLAHRHRGAGAVERLPFQMIEHILGRVIFHAPTHEAFVA